MTFKEIRKHKIIDKDELKYSNKIMPISPNKKNKTNQSTISTDMNLLTDNDKDKIIEEENEERLRKW